MRTPTGALSVTQQTPWPADREHISIKEAAPLLEPCFPPGPLVQRYEASASERARQIEEAQKERGRSKDEAALNGDYEASARADALFKHENSDDPTLKVDIVKVRRLSGLCSAILLIAQSHGVPLIDPHSGAHTPEPNEDSWIDKDGFEKIWNVLLRLGKRATLPVVCPESRGGGAVKSTISLIEAVHELRLARDLSMRAAVSEMIDLLATGQLPPVSAIIDGESTTIDPRWWWADAIEYPNSSAAFNLIVDGEPRLTRATELSIDLGAWDRLKLRIARPNNVTSLESGTVPEVPEEQAAPESEEVLTGNELDKALYQYVEETWGADYMQLPDRDALLKILRKQFPNCRITQLDHARVIRKKYAPDTLKKGGAGLRRS
jgi:hypothetical protein